MSFLHRCRQHVTGLALAALLVHALAPALWAAWTGAVAPTGAWIEVCTSLGHTRLVPAAALSGSAASDPAPLSKTVAGDCAFCAQHGSVMPMLDPGACGRIVAIGRPLLPARFFDAADPQFAWAAVRSRGPPFLA